MHVILTTSTNERLYLYKINAFQTIFVAQNNFLSLE